MIQQIVPGLIEQDDDISNEERWKWILPSALEWFAPALPVL